MRTPLVEATSDGRLTNHSSDLPSASQTPPTPRDAGRRKRQERRKNAAAADTEPTRGPAEQSLRRLRNSKINEHEFLAEFNEIRGSIREEKEQNKKALFLEMWRGTNLRRTLLSIAVICFHAANGE